MKLKLLILIASLLMFSSLAPAQQSGGDFEIISSPIDSGGGTSAGGQFSLSGTIGQPDASKQQLSGGEFLLSGGFWGKAVDRIHMDGFESD